MLGSAGLSILFPWGKIAPWIPYLGSPTGKWHSPDFSCWASPTERSPLNANL
jgi:hypothetical protein